MVKGCIKNWWLCLNAVFNDRFSENNKMFLKESFINGKTNFNDILTFFRLSCSKTSFTPFLRRVCLAIRTVHALKFLKFKKIQFQKFMSLILPTSDKFELLSINLKRKTISGIIFCLQNFSVSWKVLRRNVLLLTKITTFRNFLLLQMKKHDDNHVL